MKRNVIALTGGIGSGKSTVAKILREDFAFTVLDCDQIAKEVATEKQVLKEVVALLGEESVVEGRLNRKLVREKIFADQELLTGYNQIFHSRIRSRLCELVDALQGTVFVEIPLLDAFQFPWTEVWFVESNLEVRVERVTKRDNASRQNVLDIVSRQKEVGTFTRIIKNDGTLDDLKAAVKMAVMCLEM